MAYISMCLLAVQTPSIRSPLFGIEFIKNEIIDGEIYNFNLTL